MLYDVLYLTAYIASVMVESNPGENTGYCGLRKGDGMLTLPCTGT